MSAVKTPGADPLDAWVVRGAEPGVAPDATEGLRALLNTDDRFHSVDRLRGSGPAALVEARDALRGYLGGDAAALGELAARYPLVLAAAAPSGDPAPGDPAGGGLGLVPAPGSDPDAALVAGVLAALHRAVATGDWARLKACANPDCQWVYHDGSRNRSGRWCSMDECGDVMKARAYRRRARSGPAPA
ncbi:CGNR zinc finger domain-containing protein [Cellulomonas sp.]|uniref:CGNR zinc finger domain-containing protein n=1 Tax=Cellulomonas sp. TaxID=40001 RepID=UPI002D7610EE|nr:CGNR zinc finger domain-containing protein [Cellulomonas sp.]HYQ74535.1 CGNR zinc finger domain-containing protein [Cellulomonas sp.]